MKKPINKHSNGYGVLAISSHILYHHAVSLPLEQLVETRKLMIFKLLLILSLAILAFGSNAQEGISVDALDPRAKGESTKKAYTDDEIKWRVGFGAKQGGSEQPSINLSLSGKTSLCDGNIQLPPGWRVDRIDSGEEGDNGFTDFSDFDEFDPEAMNELDGIEIDPRDLIDENKCDETQTIRIRSDSWVSENPGIGMALQQPTITDFQIGNTGGDGYIPIIHESNGRIYMVYHGYGIRLQCVDINTGKICEGYIRHLTSGVGDKSGSYTTGEVPATHDMENMQFVGDRLFYNRAHVHNNIQYYGLGCYDVNSSQPTLAGPCDGKEGRSMFADNGFIPLMTITGWTRMTHVQAGGVHGPFYVNGKLYAYVPMQAKLYCIDPDDATACGAPYPKSFAHSKFKSPTSTSNQYFTRELVHENKLYIFSAKRRQDSFSARCWDFDTKDFCWGNTVTELPSKSGTSQWSPVPYFMKRYDTEGKFDGVCTVEVTFGKGACVKQEDGRLFPAYKSKTRKRYESRYGIPKILLERLRELWRGYGTFVNGFGTNTSKTFRIDNKDHGRTYFVSGTFGTSGVLCWDWTENAACYYKNAGSNEEITFGNNGYINHPQNNSFGYGAIYDNTYGCFWALGHANVLWSFDAKGKIPCSPTSFQATRMVDPESLYCASGAPADWKWNTIELYDFEIEDWEHLVLTIYSVESGDKLFDVNNKRDSHLFETVGNHIAIDLKNTESFRQALESEKRIKIKINGITNDVLVIQENRNPTVIATIDSKKPIEFCINSATQEGEAGCGGAMIKANMSSENGQTGQSETGVQIVQYTPDPESHTQPTYYVDQGKNDGFGIMVRPYIYPVLKQGSDIELNDISTIQALFVETGIDENGDKKLYLREDSNNDRTMEFSDKTIRYEENDKNGMGALIGDNTNIEHFNRVIPLWDAHQVLSEEKDTNMRTQRDYDAISGGRYIFTWLDTNPEGEDPNSHDGKVNSNEVQSFTDDIINVTTKGLFKDIKGGRPSLSVDRAKAIIRFVRGDSSVKTSEEIYDDSILADHPELSIVGYRDRRIIPPTRNAQETFRLGGLRHSKALIVGSPLDDDLSSRYNSDNEYVLKWANTHNLDEYKKFIDTYRERRVMVYVGGNDGMIHAFNSGFIDFNQKKVTTRSTANTSAENRPLGQEVWAYVPRAVLPYLGDLTEPIYSPRFYVDGNPVAFDVRMFEKSTTYPGGWGTILVVPMRMGGGFAEVDLSDGEKGEITPVYIVLDITDPEQEPKIIAEITHPDLGFSTSEPTIVYERNDSKIKPYLIFGSGPTNSTFAVSDRIGKVFIYDLKGDHVIERATLPTSLDEEKNKIPVFAGDMKAVNLRSEYTGAQILSANEETVLATDVVYFGTSSGTDVRQQGGRIMRLSKRKKSGELKKLGTLLLPKVANDGRGHPRGRPIVYGPTVSVSIEGKRDELWVYAGTGRLLVDADESNIEQQFILGIIENTNYDVDISNSYPVSVGPGRIDMENLVDVTDVKIGSKGEIQAGKLEGLVEGITNERQLAQHIVNDDDGDEVDGWLRKLTLNSSGDGENELVVQAGRTTGRLSIIRNQLVMSEFLPPTMELVQQCKPSGKQTFYQFNKDSGTAEDIVLTSFSVTNASLNDADYIDWDGDLAVGAGTATRLDPGEFYSIVTESKRIRWREVEEF